MDGIKSQKLVFKKLTIRLKKYGDLSDRIIWRAEDEINSHEIEAQIQFKNLHLLINNVLCCNV